MDIYFFGFISSFIQIIAIGMQNTFILRNGIEGRVLAPALVCCFCDILLISFGIFGIANIVIKNITLMRFLQYFGIIFLLGYGINSIKRAILEKNSIKLEKENDFNKTKIILTGILVSLANPHAWIDAAIILGSISAQYLDFGDRLKFYLGAITASVVWFFSLATLSKFLMPFFKNPKAWKFLDFIIGIFMFIIAFKIANDNRLIF